MPVPPDVVCTEILHLTAKARDLICQAYTVSVKYSQNPLAVELSYIQGRLGLAVESFRKTIPQPCPPAKKGQHRGSRGHGRGHGPGKKQESSNKADLGSSSNRDRVQPPKSQVDGVKPSPVQATTTVPRAIHALPARVDTRTTGQPPMAQPAVSQPKGALVDFTNNMKAVKMVTSLLEEMKTKPVGCPPSNLKSGTEPNQPSHPVKKKPANTASTEIPAAKCSTNKVSTDLTKHVGTTDSGLALSSSVAKTSLAIATVANPQSDHGTASSVSSLIIDPYDNDIVLIDLQNKTELIRPNPILIAAMRIDRGAQKANDSHWDERGKED